MCAVAFRSNVTEPSIPWRLKRRDIDSTIFRILTDTLLNAPELMEVTAEEQCSLINLFSRQLTRTRETMWEEVFPVDSRALVRLVELLTKGKETSEFRIERIVIGVFGGIEQVFSIYTDEYLGRKRFLILTTNERYDDGLMNRLLIAERDIRLQFKNVPLSFEYIPKLLDALAQVLNPNARLIWSRSLDGISRSSFATSTT